MSAPTPSLHVRAVQVLRNEKIWIAPILPIGAALPPASARRASHLRRPLPCNSRRTRAWDTRRQPGERSHQPAIAQISPQIGSHVSSLATPATKDNPILAERVANPITLTTTTYRPLPDYSALGLSAFYIALLGLVAGFVGATLDQCVGRLRPGLRLIAARSALQTAPPGSHQSATDVPR